MARSLSPNRSSKFVLLASICLVVAVLHFAQDVLVPLSLAVLISFLLTPVVLRLERWKFPRVAAVMAVVLLSFALLSGIGYVVYAQVHELAGNVDEYKTNIIKKASLLKPSGDGLFSRFRQATAEVNQAITAPATTEPATQQAEKDAQAQDPLGTVHQSQAEGEPRQTLTGEVLPAPDGAADADVQKVEVVAPKPSPYRFLAQALAPIAGPLGTAGIVVVFVIFMLLNREDLRDRVIRLFGGGQLTVTTQALDDAATRISRYLLMQAIVNGTYGVAISLGLWVIGVPSAVLWGLLCALLRFIPYIGPWIGAVFPIALSIAVFDDFRHAAFTIGLFAVVELWSNNFMEPWLYGSSTGMSTVAILAAALFWTWIWGPIGLLLSTPMTVCLVVIGKYVPQLKFLDILLGDEPVLEPKVRYYQRLLAGDAEEAMEVAQAYFETHSLEAVYDDVVMPALGLAEEDRHRGDVDPGRQKFIWESVRGHVEEIGDLEQARQAKEAKDLEKATERAAAAPTPTADAIGGAINALVRMGSRDERPDDPPPRRLPIVGSPNVRVLCLPAADEADEICAHMLAQVLTSYHFSAESVAVSTLASEMLDLVESRRANVVCVSALPPAAVTHSRYLCKRLHQKYPDLKMIVGLWNARGNVERTRQRIACVGTVAAALTIRQILEQLHEVTQPLLLRDREAEHRDVQQPHDAPHVMPAKGTKGANGRTTRDGDEEPRLAGT